MRDCDFCGRENAGHNHYQTINGGFAWLCDDCCNREEEVEQRKREQYENDFAGTRCSEACGYCGRCS